MKFIISEIKVNPDDIVSQEDNNYRIAFLARDGNPIDPLKPVWKRGENDNSETGLNPVAFLVNQQKKVRFIVTLEMENLKPGGQYRLKGFFKRPGKNVPIFSGDFSSDGSEKNGRVKKDVPVNLIFNPEAFFRMTTGIFWEVTVEKEKGTRELGDTLLEFYWLYDGDFGIFRKGVPLELLQYLMVVCRTYYFYLHGKDFDNPANSGLTPQSSQKNNKETPNWKQIIGDIYREDVIKGVVNACFYRNPPRYDIYRAARHFTDIPDLQSVKGIIAGFFLQDYFDSLHDPYAICNCSDQAAALQVFLKAIGISGVKYCRMRPFGYLRLTRLVGRGLCNNPCYGEKMLEKIFYERMLGRDHFASHDFCSLEGKVYDACTGPHIGDSKAGYAAMAVDPVQPAGNPARSGTHEDITEYQGVTYLDYIFNSEEPETAVQQDNNTTPENRFVVCKWPDPRACPVLGPGWEISREYTVPGDKMAMKMWKLQNKGESVNIRVYVSSEKYPQKNIGRLGTIGFDSSLKEKDSSREEEDGSQFSWKPIVKKIKGPEISNVLFYVRCTNVTFNVEALFLWLEQLAFTHRLKEKDFETSPFMPPMNLTLYGINHNPHTTPLKESITVKINDRMQFLMNFTMDILPDFRVLSGDGIRFVHRKVNSLEFVALKKSINKLRLVAVEKNTLLCQYKDVTIRVS